MALFSFCLTVCTAPLYAVDDVLFNVPYDHESVSPFVKITDQTESITYANLSFGAGSGNLQINQDKKGTISLLMPIVQLSNNPSKVYVRPVKDNFVQWNFTCGKGQLSVSNGSSDGCTWYMYREDMVTPIVTRRFDKGLWSFYVDDVLIDSIESNYFPSGTFLYNGPVEKGFSFRYTNPADYYMFRNTGEATPLGFQIGTSLTLLSYSFDKTVVLPDEVEVVVGKIDEISGKIDIISSNIVDIKNDVSDIKKSIDITNNILNETKNIVTNIDTTVTDVSNQLQDPSSNIWTSAKDAIGDTIKDAFVPSEEDMEQLAEEATDLAKDKLGGAYTAMETVDDVVGQLRDKLKNPSPSTGIEFPGIGFPGGVVKGLENDVTLVDKQMVTIDPKLTAILHPVAGTIFTIISALYTFRLMADMVECFFSGYSYSQFLHRDKGGGDDD